MVRIDTERLLELGYFADDARPRPLRKWQYVMDLGRIPAEMADEQIAPHAESGCREAWTRLGTAAEAASADGAAVEDLGEVIEAAACLALASLIPSAGIFYAAGASSAAREVAEMDWRYYTAEESLRLAAAWRARAGELLRRAAMADGRGTDDYVGVQII